MDSCIYPVLTWAFKQFFGSVFTRFSSAFCDQSHITLGGWNLYPQTIINSLRTVNSSSLVTGGKTA